MVRILGYGEDSLTLWALQERLPEILEAAGDGSSTADCEALYRPSFGRSGGPHSSQFGEFDFVLLTREGILLGESKWDNSGTARVPWRIVLAPEQRLRHAVFRAYVNTYAFGPYTDWDAYRHAVSARCGHFVPKPLAPAGSLLQRNLQAVLLRIRELYPGGCPVRDILLYLHRSRLDPMPEPPEGFSLVALDYAASLEDLMIPLKT
ncbi:MAG: hypothetical protein ACYCYF_06960 [Anaerolineae bacterium]